MKVKTSVTLDKSLLKDIAALRGTQSRSEFIAVAVADQLKRMKRHERDEKEIQLINKNAESLNREAAEVLKYQITL